jgi:hypothetical protein
VNELYEELFGHPKFAHWVPYNDVAAIMKSAYGIVPLVTNSSDNNSSTWIDPALKLSVSLCYLAWHQGMGIPYMPGACLESICEREQQYLWQVCRASSNALQKWQKTQIRHDAVKATMTDAITDALE